MQCRQTQGDLAVREWKTVRSVDVISEIASLNIVNNVVHNIVHNIDKRFWGEEY